MTPTTHELKTWPSEFRAIARGEKRFEYRRADRPYAVGDVLRLREWDPGDARYSGATLDARVTYLLPAGPFGVPPGYCVMSIAPIEEHEK